MENATKAISIAAGVLIALLVISLIVFGWNQISNYKKSEEETTKVEQITKFNKEFESYNKSVIRGYELVSLANLANDTNNRYTSEEGYTPINVYAMLCNDTSSGNTGTYGEYNKNARLPGASGLTVETGTKYFNILEYIKTYWSGTTSDEKKQFKELYFECTDVGYDNNLGRVCSFKYKQIFKTGTK